MMIEFLQQSLNSAWTIAKLYVAMFGGTLALALVIAAALGVGVGIWKVLQWFYIPQLAIATRSRGLGFVRTVITGGEKLLPYALIFAMWTTVSLLSGFGPWAFVLFVVLGGITTATLSYSVGAIFVSIPVCFIAWPILLRLDKQKPKLAHVPSVLVIAICWVSAFIAGFPVILTS